ncbi:hypothetical protein PIB30_078183 [Stylosanthes scabra]|uniref:Uncharacterized protein n=1 Tax=Stylosanthes scabra TaxID=79078 RepID=A0ABU6WRZ4_9FABA|nr:hypothetical protein [Stylosanthes scabra]
MLQKLISQQVQPQPRATSPLPSQALPNPKGGINAIHNEGVNKEEDEDKNDEGDIDWLYELLEELADSDDEEDDDSKEESDEDKMIAEVRMSLMKKEKIRTRSVIALGKMTKGRWSSEQKWPERAKGMKGSQQNLEGHCWTRCVRISEAMRTHPIRGRHAQKAVSAQMRTHSELLYVRISGSQHL